MKLNRTLALTLFSLLAAPALHARISVLQPWGLNFQDRRPTLAKQIDQSVGTQWGINGVSPSGAATDADFLTVPYQVTYGVVDRLEIGASWGLQWVDRPNRSSQFGIPDIVIGTRYRFFEPDRASRTPGLDLEAGFSLPAASFDKGLGTGALGVMFGWGLILPLDPARVHFGLGYRLNTENSDNIKVGNVFSYNMGLTLPWNQIPRVPRSREELSLLAELKGLTHSKSKLSGATFGSEADELYLAPGALWNSGRFQYLGNLLIGLTTDSSDIGVNFEFRF
jgi:hypothetical protein